MLFLRFNSIVDFSTVFVVDFFLFNLDVVRPSCLSVLLLNACWEDSYTVWFLRPFGDRHFCVVYFCHVVSSNTFCGAIMF